MEKKINKKINLNKKEKSRFKWNWKYSIAVLVFMIILVTVSTVSITPVSYRAREHYKTVEIRDVSETYQENYDCSFTETYQEPYDCSTAHNKNVLYELDYEVARTECMQEECSEHEQYCTETNFWGNCIEFGERCVNEKCIKYKRYCQVTIENKEREGYSFSVQLKKYNYDNKEYTTINKQDVYISALRSRTLYWDFIYIPPESVTCVANLDSDPQKEITTTNICDETKRRTIPKT